MRPTKQTTRGFSEALPALLATYGVSMRELARGIAVNHSVIARMLSGDRPVDPGRLSEIAVFFGLPSDYFAEVREAAVIEAVRQRPRLRDEIYQRLRARKT